MEELHRAHGTAMSDMAAGAETALVLVEAEQRLNGAQEVLHAVRNRLGLPDRYSYWARSRQMYEDADEHTQAQLRAEAQQDPNLDAEWDHGD